MTDASGILKVTIITVCYNAAVYIEKAIQSVLSQTYPAIEYIIIDGKSTDQTLSIINKYKTKIHKIISEPDKGIYDAMNRGLRLAEGDIVYFLNADDRFYDDRVVEDIVQEFGNNNALGLVLGKVQLVNLPAGSVLPLKNPWRTVFNRKRDFILAQVCHQRIFCRKIVFEKIGLFNLKYRIFADYDWFLRAVYQQCIPIKYLDRDVAYFNIQGKSHIEGHCRLHEKLSIILKNSWYDFAIYAWDKACASVLDLVKRRYPVNLL